MRQFTDEEVREQFLGHVRMIIDYWDGRYDKKVTDKSCREKLEGLAFSLLVALDGESTNLPKFIVAPDPHPTDRAYHEAEEENWWPENHGAHVECDIAGGLHDHLFTRKS